MRVNSATASQESEVPSESVPYALELSGVSLRYPNGFEALHEVTMCVTAAQIVALVGASGSGKSTILRAVTGLEAISSGTIRVNGVLVESAGCADDSSSSGYALAGRAENRKSVRIPIHKRAVGFVFQDGQLFPHMSVARNIAYGLAVCGWSRAEQKERVAELLALVDLQGFEERSVQTLSGGQAQRVALARSLAPKPQLLLLDEPLSALDADLRESLSAQLRTILKQTGTAAVYVTHDSAEAQRVSDRIVRISNGRIC